MNEFVKFECACNAGYDKGALKKTIENNIFTIFGNLNQKNSIVIRYHGQLTEDEDNNSTEFNMFYFFDNNTDDKKTIKLQKCTKCHGDCYCAVIDLDIYHSFNFGFFDNNNRYELNKTSAFRLEIAPDPISNLMQRYGFEQNTNLPVYEQSSDKMFILKNIFNSIKYFFNNLFDKISSV